MIRKKNAQTIAETYINARQNNTSDTCCMKYTNGEEIALCSYSEYMDLVEELHDFLWYKLNRIIKKHNPTYFTDGGAVNV